ncbi:predicted protein [Coccidioides posadasii str. Silveira]|uniref:Predicted protein n=1 Tax=Coccidioides posadasii (strain RMSCC 757 / Silveira) TaxID=443226 RepID=E9CYM4_COCPS|nr:predicted protein [Coccidioides posadasii str. Silveira]
MPIMLNRWGPNSLWWLYLKTFRLLQLSRNVAMDAEQQLWSWKSDVRQQDARTNAVGKVRHYINEGEACKYRMLVERFAATCRPKNGLKEMIRIGRKLGHLQVFQVGNQYQKHGQEGINNTGSVRNKVLIDLFEM